MSFVAVGCSQAGEMLGMSICGSSALPRSGSVSVQRLREPGFGGGPQIGTTGPWEGVMACGGRQLSKVQQLCCSEPRAQAG